MFNRKQCCLRWSNGRWLCDLNWDLEFRHTHTHTHTHTHRQRYARTHTSTNASTYCITLHRNIDTSEYIHRFLHDESKGAWTNQHSPVLWKVIGASTAAELWMGFGVTAPGMHAWLVVVTDCNTACVRLLVGKFVCISVEEEKMVGCTFERRHLTLDFHLSLHVDFHVKVKSKPWESVSHTNWRSSRM